MVRAPKQFLRVVPYTGFAEFCLQVCYLNSGKPRKANISSGSRKVAFLLHFFPLNPNIISAAFPVSVGIYDTEVRGCMQAH